MALISRRPEADFIPKRRRSALTRALTLACWCVGAGAMPLASAADLPALIRDAVSADPAVLEARASEEVAEARLNATRAQRWPVLGVQAGSNVVNPSSYYSTPFRGVTGRLNVYSAGAIGSAIERDRSRQQSLQYKTEEIRQQVAFNVANHYLQALAAQELLDAQKLNLVRHEKIIGDLEVVVANDQGRRYELVQAQSRALQVRMAMVQQEKARNLALSRLTRYTAQKPTLQNPVAADWEAALPAELLQREHPTLQSLQQEAEAVRRDRQFLAQSRWPRVDVEAGAGNNSYVRLVANWSFFDRSADYTVDSAARQIVAAERRGELLTRELAEQADTARADMAQSQLQIKAAEQQIGASTEVARLYEMQFKVGRRSLIELVNAYAELSSVETSRVVAENAWRGAVLTYLHARAALADWAQAPR